VDDELFDCHDGYCTARVSIEQAFG
jgi:hypothetical protein